MQVILSDTQLQAMITAKGQPSFEQRARAGGSVEAVYEDDVRDERLQELVGACDFVPEHKLRVVVGDRWVLVGGLVHDPDVESPLEGDGMGRILHASRDAAEIRSALGLDQYGERNYKLGWVQEIFEESVRKRVRRDRNLKARLTRAVVRHGGRADALNARLTGGAIRGGAAEHFAFEITNLTPHNLKESGNKADLRLLEDCEVLAGAMEQLAVEAWEQARREGKIGEPLAVMLDVFKHGSVHYSLHGHGPQCRWDTSRPGAMWVPDECAREAIAMVVAQTGVEPIEAAKRSAEVAASEFAKWANGETFGVVVSVFDRATGERITTHDYALWGLIGMDYATDELESTVLGMIPDLNKALLAH